MSSSILREPGKQEPKELHKFRLHVFKGLKRERHEMSHCSNNGILWIKIKVEDYNMR